MAILIAGVAAVLGAVLASFAGVISERLATGDSWTSGRSRCNSCGHSLSVLDLVPILSYLLSQGHCRHCRARVPARYLFAECALALSFFLATLMQGLTLALAVLLFLLFVLAIIVLYDLRHTIVPMPLALLLVATAFVYAVLSSDSLHSLGLTLLVAGGVGLAFLMLHTLSSGRWMGLGDAPVALSLSLLVGSHAFTGLVYSFWIGAVVGIAILVSARRGHRMGIEVPFVPFLAAGYLLALFTPWNPFLL